MFLKNKNRLKRMQNQISFPICKDKGFWRTKFLSDFGQQKQTEGKTWKEMYQRLSIQENDSPIAAGLTSYSILNDQGNFYIGWGSDIENPQKISMNSKVVNISQGDYLLGAVTEDGTAYIWRVKSVKSNLPSTSQKKHRTIKLIKTIKFDDTKAVKVVILYDFESGCEDVGYAVIMDNGDIYLETAGYDEYLRPNNSCGNFIDIAVSNYVYVLSSTGTSSRVGVLKGEDGLPLSHKVNRIIYHAVVFPEPIIKLTAKNFTMTALSKAGNIYIWGEIMNGINTNTPRYTKITTIQDFTVYKINLFQPISSIFISNYKILTVTRDGRLYVWRYKTENQPDEIDIGGKVKYVAAGNNFVIAMTIDGAVNYWKN